MIFNYFKTKLNTIALVLIFTGTVGCSVYWLKGHTAPQLIGEAFFKVNTSKKLVALTFDDGPSLPFTAEILDILKKHNVKATFFVLGGNAEKYPELLKRMYKEGHEIGNHSWSHERLVFKTPKFIKDEIESTDKIIRASGYDGPIHFRAPYGNKLIILPWILKSMNRPHILFDLIAKDWEFPTAQVMTQRVIDGLHPGAIILFHDGGGDKSNVVQALDLVIIGIKQRGYELLKINDLIQEGMMENRDSD